MHCSDIQCCCGRDDCAYRQHTTAALEGLEKDVDAAARVGQALLERHESYVAEAEGGRKKMVAEIDELEKNKREVLAENARLIEDNRNLVDQLEDMNQALTESDAYIKSLETTLESSQLEIRRLTVTASRAEQLEAQLSELEADQAGLQEKLASAEENEKTAIQRRKRADMALQDLQDQLDRMEREAKEERERHAELLGQMEKKRTSEGRFGPAAGKLKTAGSAGSLGRQKNGTSVVSDFVGDILQDNANLQASIAEMKEMLHSSDQEIQDLREQVMLHQPLSRESNETPKRNKLPTLSEELRGDSPTPVSQEFHVHHHYHNTSPAPQSKRDKSQSHTHRRHKRRRPVFPPTLLESPSRESTTPRRPIAHSPHDSTSSTSTALSPLSLSMPSSALNHRWSSSTASQVLSSSPSSPNSAYPSESVFDRGDREFESSRPTSPESTGFSSPVPKAHHLQRPSDTSINSVFETDKLGQRPQMPAMNNRATSLSPIETTAETRPGYDNGSELPGERTPTAGKQIMEPSPEGQSAYSSPSQGGTSAHISQFSSSVPTGNGFGRPARSPYRATKQSTAHLGLTSFPAMDVHSSIPRSYFDHCPEPPKRVSSAGTIFSSVTPVISRTNITIPKISVTSGEDNHRSSISLLSSVASAAATSRSSSPSRASALHSSIGQRVGGWVFERWRPSTAGSHSSVDSNAGDSTSSVQSSEGRASRSAAPIPASVRPRPTGVNQKGSIAWLRPPPKAPSSIHPSELDEELLQESLQE